MTINDNWEEERTKYIILVPDSLSEETKRLLADPTEVAEWASVIRIGERVDCGIPR